MTKTTIQTATSRGQVTLPAAWRKQFNTNNYLLQWSNKTLEIQPIDIKELVEGKNEITIFDADKDNDGKELSGTELRKIITELNG